MTKDSLKKPPLVSVVMPIYNCVPYLPEAIVSLLIQTFTDFEIIAVNDGSTDDSLSILKRFAKFDSRIKIIDQKNSGIVKALNRGIKESRGKYIARMDGDDISFPNRFKEQVAILERDPSIVLVAGDFEVIDESSQTMYREQVAPDNEFIQRAFYLRNAIAHGSVMFRKSAIESIGHYSNEYGPTEDMELWMRLLDYGKFSATGTSIYRWRVNSQGITSTNNPESIRQATEHLHRRWAKNTPEYLTRKALLRKTRSYLIDFERNGQQYKHAFLTDTAQIAVKYASHGHRKLAAQQLLAVAVTGRQGLRIVAQRIKSVIGGRLHR